jgi:hypothetical protein
MFSNLIIYNPLALFFMTLDNLLCAIVIHRFILLTTCLCPCVSCIEFSSFSSSSIFQFEFLMQWHFLSSYSYIVVRFISVFVFSFNLDGYFTCNKKARSYHLSI